MTPRHRIPEASQSFPITLAALAYAQRLHARQRRRTDGAPFDVRRHMQARTRGSLRNPTDQAGHFCLCRIAAHARSDSTRAETCVRVATQLHCGSPRDAVCAGKRASTARLCLRPLERADRTSAPCILSPRGHKPRLHDRSRTRGSSRHTRSAGHLRCSRSSERLRGGCRPSSDREILEARRRFDDGIHHPAVECGGAPKPLRPSATTPVSHRGVSDRGSQLHRVAIVRVARR